jgi:selenoprotein W-related protein
MVELLKKYEREIEAISLIPSGNGLFEVMVNGNLIFSKESFGRHAEEGEVDRLLQESLSG